MFLLPFAAWLIFGLFPLSKLAMEARLRAGGVLRSCWLEAGRLFLGHGWSDSWAQKTEESAVPSLMRFCTGSRGEIEPLFPPTVSNRVRIIVSGWLCFSYTLIFSVFLCELSKATAPSCHLVWLRDEELGRAAAFQRVLFSNSLFSGSPFQVKTKKQPQKSDETIILCVLLLFFAFVSDLFVSFGPFWVWTRCFIARQMR